MFTKHKIHYYTRPVGSRTLIPAGTPVREATNLPDGGWWAQPWESMSDDEISWMNNYGFFIESHEVCSNKLRVRVTVDMLVFFGDGVCKERAVQLASEAVSVSERTGGEDETYRHIRPVKNSREVIVV